MLHHHSDRPYEEAARDAATEARQRMDKLIENGRPLAGKLMEYVEANVPADTLIRGRALRFHAKRDGARTNVLVDLGDSAQVTVHPFALGQIAHKAHVPMHYVKSLAERDEEAMAELLAHNLNEHFAKTDLANERHLCRIVDGKLRGFLSDRYMALDARSLARGFAGACRAIGAVPVDATFTDTRVAIKAFLPRILEPVPNEVMMLGVEWFISEFGNGAHSVRFVLLRLWCTNKAVAENALHQVHLGMQLPEGIEFSAETIELMTKTHASQLSDVVFAALGPKRVNMTLETIRAANETQIPWANVERALSRTLGKRELEEARAAFDGSDVVNLPRGATAWRMSNALSFMANAVPDRDRAIELERLAGRIATRPQELLA